MKIWYAILINYSYIVLNNLTIKLMSTYTQILYQIVFSTKHRKPTLIKQNREELFRFIWGILEKKNCHLYRINGVEDHIHVLTHIHPTVSLSSLIKDKKYQAHCISKTKNCFMILPPCKKVTVHFHTILMKRTG